jgi:nucleoid DNA-binding protein
MTKADLARAVYERHGGISLQGCQHIVDLIFATIKRRLLAGDQVQIAGFGVMEIIERRSRRKRNPAKGASIDLPIKHAIIFRPSRAINSYGFRVL